MDRDAGHSKVASAGSVKPAEAVFMIHCTVLYKMALAFEYDKSTVPATVPSTQNLRFFWIGRRRRLTLHATRTWLQIL